MSSPYLTSWTVPKSFPASNKNNYIVILPHLSKPFPFGIPNRYQVLCCHLIMQLLHSGKKSWMDQENAPSLGCIINSFWNKTKIVLLYISSPCCDRKPFRIRCLFVRVLPGMSNRDVACVRYQTRLRFFSIALPVVVTLSFNAKMVLANFECNLMTRDSQKWPRKGDLSLWECRGSGPEIR